MLRLILNADDFGYDPAVTRGIAEAMRQGVVSSTTMIVNSPWSEEAAAQAEGLAIGLHLNLVRFESVSQPSVELTERGHHDLHRPVFLGPRHLGDFGDGADLIQVLGLGGAGLPAGIAPLEQDQPHEPGFVFHDLADQRSDLAAVQLDATHHLGVG